MVDTQHSGDEGKSNLKDHSYLIKKVINYLDDPENNFVQHRAGDYKECNKIGYENKRRGDAFVVMDEDTAIELGSPQTDSISRVLLTNRPGFVGRSDGNRIWIGGKDLDKIKSRSVSFLQLILLELEANTDPTDSNLHRLKNLTNKIPGYMTRTVPEKIWIRVHKRLLKKGFSLYSLGQCLYQNYKDSIDGLKKIDIILAADAPELVNKFKPICVAAKIISDENRKLKWEEDGVVSCEDLNCNSCEEQPTCDTLRDIVVKKKRDGKKEADK